MNKSDLVEALSKGEDLTRTKAEETVNLVFNEMTNALVAGDRVSWEREISSGLYSLSLSPLISSSSISENTVSPHNLYIKTGSLSINGERNSPVMAYTVYVKSISKRPFLQSGLKTSIPSIAFVTAGQLTCTIVAIPSRTSRTIWDMTISSPPKFICIWTSTEGAISKSALSGICNRS